MNILKLLDKLSDDTFFSKQTSRLDNLSDLSTFGKKAAVAALPLGLGSFLATSAKAETKNEPTLAMKSALTDALQLALTLEYLEDEYYRIGLQTANLIPASDKVVFQQISKHETAHVTFLKSTLNSLNVAPIAKPTFDFTVNGAFSPFTNYQQFLVLAQAFEDTGVRAYKGQAGNVMSNGAVLQAALQIHSVEARHASMVRRMRANKGWIELASGGSGSGGMPAATNAVYAGEDVTVQAGFNTATTFGAAAGSAAYDEVLTGAEATAIASLFID
ncbi:ferritin-like domain-containing protein [Chryseobacterium wangxinyae]|uniref:ferritin-like domain-containing protein n=1 Tax=Chryseobacterium sp. CY350 TaxID=2997336 RepID=UPI00226E5789|nr:ferritin-like domain-containing protein [Chryseobacterium sp. CY350]MCY0975717.1 ferritin-like domain-containing protein [Chryseobacterium sp. CY350]WBZ94673.1 ferritin-like domain-containing protein [Chryseobacterium sp. CY350]